MKKRYNVISAILIIIILTLSVIIYKKSDRDGPVIEFPKNKITYTEGEDLKVLLSGVKAIDLKDGDVSDTLIIENLVPLSNGTTAKVTYAAQDRDSHIIKKSLIVNYVALNIEKNDTSNNQNTITPGLVNNDKSVVAQNISPIITPTIMPKENKVKEKPVIKLNTKEITLVKGSKFEVLTVVKEIKDNKDQKDDIYTRIHIDGYYNLKVPGTYILEYYVIDSDQNKSAPAYLKLVIE